MDAYKKKPRFRKVNAFYAEKVPEVRVVGDGIETAIYPTLEALRLADDKKLDLIEISTKAVPPVCRLDNYTKFKYEQEKKAKAQRQKTSKIVTKEIRFSPNTQDHDFQFKLRYARDFLQQGERLKAYVQFRSREIIYKERGELLLLNFAESLADHGKLEHMPKLEGKRMHVLILPNAKK